ncbi:MAG: hypothetical protein GY898_28655 [Proteobacteria bacterium]|nr:hypothetical protein [Pseudomonadota bacterium]
MYDPSWRLISKDEARDALPVATVVPPSTGTYYVKIKMYRGSGHANYAVCYD